MTKPRDSFGHIPRSETMRSKVTTLFNMLINMLDTRFRIASQRYIFLIARPRASARSFPPVILPFHRVILSPICLAIGGSNIFHADLHFFFQEPVIPFFISLLRILLPLSVSLVATSVEGAVYWGLFLERL